MAKKTLRQKVDSLPHENPRSVAEKQKNRAVISESFGKVLATNRRRFRGNWDLALNDDNLMGRMYDLLRRGNYVETAVVGAGIPRSVYRRWRRQGEEDIESGVESQYALFVDAVESIHHLSEAEMVDKIYQAGMTGESMPTALCWLLERVRGTRFKQNVPSAAQQTNVQVNINGVRAPSAGSDYKTWLENKRATEDALSSRPDITRGAVEVPPGIETVEISDG
tara:strand:+ start:889 stop:1557 length:669 start_codon:yes stop_codon:yes gene_type:complete